MILTVLLFLDLFLSSDGSICSTIAFPPLGDSDIVLVSDSIDFSSYSHWDALFHGYSHSIDYSHADWDDLHDHLRNFLW